MNLEIDNSKCFSDKTNGENNNEISKDEENEIHFTDEFLELLSCEVIKDGLSRAINENENYLIDRNSPNSLNIFNEQVNDYEMYYNTRLGIDYCLCENGINKKCKCAKCLIRSDLKSKYNKGKLIDLNGNHYIPILSKIGPTIVKRDDRYYVLVKSSIDMFWFAIIASCSLIFRDWRSSVSLSSLITD